MSYLIKTDLLVIGGGLAGLIAALEANQLGLDVTIVSKKKVGRSGNTVVSGGALSVVVPEIDNKDSAETYFHDLLQSGKHINQKELTRRLAEDSLNAISLLEKYGVTFFKMNNQYVKRKPPGHTFPRSVPTIWDGYSYMTRGLTFTAPLQEYVMKQKIKVLDSTIITKLIKKEGRIVGANAFKEDNNERIIISCSAVVIASGGAGWIYANTNNTRDITGDSYALAYQAGATLIDMEFVQFYPSMIIKPFKMPASNPLFGDGAVLRNKYSERFMHNYDEKGDMATRDKMAQSIYMEVEKGNGIDGGVYFDCSAISKDVLETKYSHFTSQLRKKGLDPSKDMVIVAPSTHYFLGGIKINQNSESDIPGLFVAGEAVGGIHGANRLSGSSLADTVIFGSIAGRSAGTYALEYKGKNDRNLPIEEDMDTRINPKEKNTKYDLQDIKERLRRTMWDNVSVIRNETDLKEALKVIEALESGFGNIRSLNTNDVITFNETKNMLVVAKLVVKGALERKESRGSHMRSDFPNENSEFLGNYYYQNIGNRHEIQFHPLDEFLKKT